jgi:molybdate transport system permease protein
MFAGSLRGVTQTAPLAVYDLFSTNLIGAEAVAAVLVAASGSVLLISKLAVRGRQ